MNNLQEQAVHIWVFENSYQEIQLQGGYPWLSLILELGFGSVRGLHLGYEWPSEKSFLLALRDAILLENHKQITGKAETGNFYIPQKVLFREGGYNFNRFEKILNKLKLDLSPLSSEIYLFQNNLKNQHYKALDKDLLSNLPGWMSGENNVTHQTDAQFFLSINELKEHISNFFFKDYNCRPNLGTKGRARFECWEKCISRSTASLSRLELETLLVLD